MKKFRRSVAMLLALVMLTGLLPMHVFAQQLETFSAQTPDTQKDAIESDPIPFPETLTLGEKKTLNFSAGQVRILKFVPESDGVYAFFSEGNWDTYGKLFDEENQIQTSDDEGEELNFYIQEALTAGKTYYLHASFLNENDTGSFVVSVVKKVAATAMNFSVDNYTKVAEGSDTYSLYLNFGPENAAIEHVEVSVTDPQILCFNCSYSDPYENRVYLEFNALSEGSVTVTATGDSGLTDSIQVTVLPAGMVALGTQHITVSADVWDFSALYTVPENGVYQVTCENFPDGIGCTPCFIHTQTGEILYMQDNNQFRLEAGTYYFVAHFYDRPAGSLDFDLTLKTLIPATKLEITNEILNGRVGNDYYPEYRFLPENAIYEAITITSDNPAVAKVTDWGSLALLSAGTANVTVTSESGLSDTVTLTVTEAPALEYIQMDYDSINAYVGVPLNLSVCREPYDSAPEEITWSVSDPAVASFTVDENSEYATLTFTATGTFTVTATSESGKSATCTVTVKIIPSMTESSTADLTMENYESQMVKFTVSASGKYRIAPTVVPEDYLDLEVHDENMNFLEYSNGLPFVDCSFEAGKVYFINVYLSTDQAQTLTLGATALVPMTSFALDTAALTGTAFSNALVKAVFAPENAATEAVEYQITDPEIASVESINKFDARVYFLKKGTATLTATTESGKTASVSVTVTEPEALVTDVKKEIQVPFDRSVSMKFTPQATGYYRFKFYNEENLDFYLYDENADIVFGSSGQSFYEEVKLVAEKTYHLVVSYYDSEGACSCQIIVTKPPAPTSLTLTIDENFSDYAGLDLHVSYSFAPADCHSEQVTLTSSNPEVVQADPEASLIHLLKPGTATVTVTSESGLTDSFTVTVLDPTRLEFNTDTTVELISVLHGEKKACFAFTPEEDGVYSLQFTGAKQVLFSADFCDVSGEIKSDSEAVNFPLQKGEEYIFTIYYHAGLISSFNVKMTEAVALETLEIVSLPKQMDYFKDYENFDYYGLALKGTLIGGAEVTWTEDGSDRRLGGHLILIEDYYDDSGNYQKTVITCNEKTVEFAFRVAENPVDRLELVEGTAITYLENCDGYWNGEFFYYYANFPADAKVKIHYKDESTKVVTLSDTPDFHYSIDWIHGQDQKPWVVGTNNTTISYLGKEVTLPITLLPSPVESIQYVGETIQIYENADGYETDEGFFYFYKFLVGAQIKVTKKDSSSQIHPIFDENGESIFEYESTQDLKPWVKGETNYVTVTYHGKTCKIPVVVVDNPVERIELLSAPGNNYYFGDLTYGWMDNGAYYLQFPDNLEGLSFRIHYVGGRTVDVSDADLVKNNYNGSQVLVQPEQEGPHTVGSYTVALNYMGKTLTYDISIVPSPVTSLEVVSLPENVFEDDWRWPDLRETKIKIHYANGTHQTVTFTRQLTEIDTTNAPAFLLNVDGAYMELCFDYNRLTWVAQYMGVTVDLTVPYKNEPQVKKIDLIRFDPDLTGTVFLVTYEDGSTQEVTLGEFYSWHTSANYSFGYAETDDGLIMVEWSYYPDERNYGFLQLQNATFVFSLDDISDALPGDVDGNGAVDLDDAIYLLYHVNFKDTYHINQDGDFDGNGTLDLDDAIYLLYHVNFKDTYPLH